MTSLKQMGKRSIIRDSSTTLPQDAWVDLELNVPVTVGTVAFRSQEPRVANSWLATFSPVAARDVCREGNKAVRIKQYASYK